MTIIIHVIAAPILRMCSSQPIFHTPRVRISHHSPARFGRLKVVWSQSFHLFHINDDYINKIVFATHSVALGRPSSSIYTSVHITMARWRWAPPQSGEYVVVVVDSVDDDSGDLFLSEKHTHTMEWCVAGWNGGGGRRRGGLR